MQNKRLFPVLWAVAALFIASLACNALFPTPGVSGLYMATDEAGTIRTTVFPPTDDLM